MRNKKGFTLIELLAVIAIIALISLIAIPNIIGLSTGIKKDNMLDDAKKLISLAKFQVNKNYTIRANPPRTFTFAELNVNGDLKNDPDGGPYDQLNSKVTYSVNSSNVAEYCVILIGSVRSVKNENGTCIKENVLYSRANVRDNS